MKIKDVLYIDKAYTNDWGHISKSAERCQIISSSLSPAEAGRLYAFILAKIGEEEYDK